MILRCVNGKPCSYYCVGREQKSCKWVHDDVLDQIVKAVEEDNAKNAETV